MMNKDSLKLLLSAYACEPNRGSEPGNGWYWARYLAELGHEITLLTRSNGKKAIDKEIAQNPLPNLKFVYVQLPRYGKFMLNGALRDYFHYFHYYLWQKAALQELKQHSESFDLVHHVTYGTILFASQLWRLPLPFILGPVGGGQIAPKQFSNYFDTEWTQEQLRTLAHSFVNYIPSMHTMLKNTELVLASNAETQLLAHDLGAKRIDFMLDACLPDDYVLDRVPLREVSQKLKILWVGRICGRKALPLAFEAISHMSAPFELTILGDGSLGSKIPTWLQQYNLSDSVQWKGRVPWEVVKSAYLQHDVLLFTSLRDSGGVQLLEAMAHGLPVVTLNHQGARVMVPDEAGIKVPVGNPSSTVLAITEALDYLAHSLEMRQKMGWAGLNFARSQVWSIRVQEMAHKYLDVLSSQV